MTEGDTGMAYDHGHIIKDGTISIESIYQLDGVYGVEALLQECRDKNCTIYFQNEDLTVTPEDQNSTDMRAKIHSYEMIMNYPTAAKDYFNYIFKEYEKQLKR